MLGKSESNYVKWESKKNTWKKKRVKNRSKNSYQFPTASSSPTTSHRPFFSFSSKLTICMAIPVSLQLPFLTTNYLCSSFSPLCTTNLWLSRGLGLSKYQKSFGLEKKKKFSPTNCRRSTSFRRSEERREGKEIRSRG